MGNEVDKEVGGFLCRDSPERSLSGQSHCRVHSFLNSRKKHPLPLPNFFY